MSKDLDEALEYLLEEEGGWSNHPADRGGATMYGVTQATYDGFRKAVGRPQQSVKNLTKQEAREVYDGLYWRAAGCDRLAWPISYITFDAAVNSGVGRAVKWTQAGLGLTADGKIGPKTVEAAAKAVHDADGRAILAIVDQRGDFLAGLVRKNTSQLAFVKGWWSRTLAVLARALTADLED